MTNGVDWRLGVVPTAQIFHTHALAARDGALVAATSAWRAGLQRSLDGGGTWEQIYDRPTPERRLSRILELVPHNGALYGAAVDRLVEGPRYSLLRFADAELAEPPGWPVDTQVHGLAALDDWMYGLAAEPGGTTIWRTDGMRSERLVRPTGGVALRDMVAGTDGLWAVSATGDGGSLWFSGGAREWTRLQDLVGGVPNEVAVVGDRAYVGGRGNDGRGIVWGPPPAPAAATRADPAPMPDWPDAERDWPALGARLDVLLADEASYQNRESELRDVLLMVAQGRPPDGFFAARLAVDVPELPMQRFGGAGRVTTPNLARFMLYWAMANAGSGTALPADLADAWVGDDRRSQKFVEPLIGGMYAASWTGQRDRAVVAALVTRLGRAKDPLWLKGDAVGALTAITGQRFGYDAAAWRVWWEGAGPGWR